MEIQSNKNSNEFPSLVSINRILEEADKEGLVPEVVTSALMLMKENNKLTVEDAIQLGYDEWIK
jgi:hypothetical protein